MKKCITCRAEKELEEFYKHPFTSDGRLGKCKDCCKRYQSTRDTRAYDLNRYRNNVKRHLSVKYSMIKTRCSGSKQSPSYAGREFLTREEWDKWCEQSYSTFISLYENWRASGFQKRLAPSIDRVDNNKGYIVGNLQWLTQSANTSKFTH